MGVAFLKLRDTRPILQVELLEPDPLQLGRTRAHDLTGSTAWKLHIWLADGSKLTRAMVKGSPDYAGILTYTWIDSDWDTVSAGGAVGGLVVGPTFPILPGLREHRMEYEVVGPAGARLTFPNDGYDTLRIVADIGQA